MVTTVYALSTCPYCKMARKYLTDNDVQFGVVEVDLLEGEAKTAAVDEVKRLSGGTSFPVMVIGDEVVVGFDKSRVRKLLGL